MDSRKILMTIGNLDAGGKERQLIELLKGLKKSSQFDTYVAVMNPDGLWKEEAEKYANIVVQVNRKFQFDLVTPLIYLSNLIKKERINIIHSWGSGLWDLISLILARINHKHYVHGGIQSSPAKLDFSDRLCRWSALFADVVVSNSYAGLIAYGMNKDNRSRVIYNGMDMSRFDGLLEETYQKEFNLCMVANFSHKKDHCTLISSLPTIIKAFPNVSLKLVGHDAGTLGEVKSFAKNLGVENHIEYITDTLEPEPIIAKSQVGILSTYSEGVANALLEYMALSKSVIVTDKGGSKEVVIEDETGYLVPLRNPEKIAEKVIFLLENPEKARQMGAAGRKRVIEKFSKEQLIYSFEAIYHQLIN